MANEPNIQTFKGMDDQWYNRIQAANGETLMVSEGYPDMATAQDNMDAVERALAEILEEKGTEAEDPAVAMRRFREGGEVPDDAA